MTSRNDAPYSIIVKTQGAVLKKTDMTVGDTYNLLSNSMSQSTVQLKTAIGHHRRNLTGVNNTKSNLSIINQEMTRNTSGVFNPNVVEK